MVYSQNAKTANSAIWETIVWIFRWFSRLLVYAKSLFKKFKRRRFLKDIRKIQTKVLIIFNGL